MAFFRKPFQKRPATNLVASKAVDLSPPMEDPERPSFDSFTAQGLHLDAPATAPVDFYKQQLPAEHQAEIPPLEKQDLDGAIAAGAVVVAHNEATYEKSGMPHSDSAVSLPSNASSVQAPGTPIAPAVVNTGEACLVLCFAQRKLLHKTCISSATLAGWIMTVAVLVHS